MKIAIDAMGGDYAPEEVVKGAVLGAKKHRVGVILVGPEQVVEQELGKHDRANTDIEVVVANEYLKEGGHPAFALRTKRNASVAVATRLVKEGRADAVISGWLHRWGGSGSASDSGQRGRDIAASGWGNFLGFAPKTVVMDAGGNVDCRPDQLLDFGIVGAVYARKILGIENPTVALLSTGAEEGKGNQQVRDSYAIF